MIAAFAALACSYLLGACPFGLWLGLRFKGIDIREHGSRNIGATNTLRVLGKPLGAAALLLDITKGYLPVVLFARFAPYEWAPLACGVAAILGHTFSVFVRFRGGKGVATSAGVFLGLCPGPMLIAALVFILVVAATHMVSAGSCLAALALAISVVAMPYGWTLRIVAILVAVLVIVKHRSNIQRIFRGEENKLW